MFDWFIDITIANNVEISLMYIRRLKLAKKKKY